MRASSLAFLTAVLLAVALTLAVSAAPLDAQTGPSTAATGIRVGDRIYLSVDGEKALTDSFTVSAGPSLELPLVGILSLVGVQRTDLESVLTKAIGRYIKNPVVRVKIRPRIRLTVLGAVGKPGFLDVPAEALLSEVITLAGGPAPDAKLNGMRLTRGDSTLLKGDTVKKALDAGVTLSQLGLQSGDELSVPLGGGVGRTLGRISAVIGGVAGLYYLILLTQRR